MKILSYSEKIFSNYIIAFLLLTTAFIFVFCEKLSTLFSLLIGSYITWLVSRAYYLKAGKELEYESSKIRDALKIVALKQQNPEAYQIKINNEGNIGATVEMSANLHGSSKFSANLSGHEKVKNDTQKTNK